MTTKAEREKELEWSVENTRGLIDREKKRYRNKLRITRQNRDTELRKLKKQLKVAKTQLKQIKRKR